MGCSRCGWLDRGAGAVLGHAATDHVPTAAGVSGGHSGRDNLLLLVDDSRAIINDVPVTTQLPIDADVAGRANPHGWHQQVLDGAWSGAWNKGRRGTCWRGASLRGATTPCAP
ncbi:hypothetical protein E2C01_018218 [Portunus trituberculatus]|uniref:Uncharacterized protein n=1 Tax=Portunus trituberculatus TaxID=210409 RepID=A0A5B7DUI1_PORTR|nr:hypothetical protein [Portunus trituberculatus]